MRRGAAVASVGHGSAGTAAMLQWKVIDLLTDLATGWIRAPKSADAEERA